MTRSGWVEAWQRARSRAGLLAITALCAAAFPQQSIAAQVQAYVIFETRATSNAETVADKLRSTSLNNCLLIIVGRRARDVLVHVACDEQANSNYLGRAFAELSSVDGVARANLVLVKAGTE